MKSLYKFLITNCDKALSKSQALNIKYTDLMF